MSTTETKVRHTTYGITIAGHPAARGPYTNVPGYHIYERLSEGCIGNQIAFVYNANGTDENAQRIVRAVNSHADMLQAATDALESLKRLPDVDGAYRVTCIQQLETAINKARGIA